MRIAVLFNKNSASASSALGPIADDLLVACRGHRMVAHSLFGARYFNKRCEVVEGDALHYGLDYKAMVRDAVHALVASGVQRFVTVGGDGLAAYVADALRTACIERSLEGIPLLGVAAGTANVGPIVSVPAHSVSHIRPEEGFTIPTGAVEAFDGADHLGYGFNDVVVGDTLLGTVDGKTVNVSVEALVREGRNRVQRPGGRIAGGDFAISVNGVWVCRPGDLGPADVKQIVASSLQFDRLYGRAVTGALMRGAYERDVAALVLSDRFLVSAFDEGQQNTGLQALRQLTFTVGERVTLSGLGPDAHVVVDGNPYIRGNGEISFAYVPDVVRVWRIEGVCLRKEPWQEERGCSL